MSTACSFGRSPAGDEVRRSLTNAQMSAFDWRAALLKRISQYEKQGVTKAQPFRAFLAAVQAELIRISITLEDAALRAMGQCPSTPESTRAIARYLRTLRQIEQYVRLEIISNTGDPSRSCTPVKCSHL
jgi:hypothetical protein